MQLEPSNGVPSISRRNFLASTGGLILARSQSCALSPVQFVDVAQEAGLTTLNVNGGNQRKRYIIESTGSGIAFFDYNHDGFPDIFMVNGTTLEGFPLDKQPTNHLFRNNGDGTFTDVTVRAGLAHSGWGQGVCVGDYDNDGWLDLFVTYYGQRNVLYHNNGDGTFTDITIQAGLASADKDYSSHYSTGCAFVDYNRDGWLDLFVAHYTDFDLRHAPAPGAYSACRWKGVPVFCGPKGLPLSHNRLYRNNGNGTFSDVSETAGILGGNQGYAFSVLTADFRNCGWPDIYVSCDSTPSLLYRNCGDGTFSEVGLAAGVAYSNAGVAQAWDLRRAIMTAMVSWIFSRPISSTTLPTCTITTAMEVLQT